MDLSHFKRIAIIGRPGSGKSTFAIQLAQTLDIPVFHVDKIFFTDNWVESPKEGFLRLHTEWINQPTWIIDGNALNSSLGDRYAKADCVIAFTPSKWLCLWRVIKRRFSKTNPRIDDRASNCPERISWKLITYLWTYENRLHPLLQQLKLTYPDVTLIIVTSDDVSQTNLPPSIKREASYK